MRTTIDSAGRVVIPRDLRMRLGLSGGDPVEILERDGHLEIGIVSSAMRLEGSEHGPVAVPEEDLPPLTEEIVRSTIERSRR